MKFNAETVGKALKIIAAVASAAGNILGQFWPSDGDDPKV